MRFKRSDIGAILVAALAPAMLSYIVFQGWGLLHLEGVPWIGMIAGNFAVGGGVIAYLMRYLSHKQTFEALAELTGLAFLAVLAMQFADADHTVWSLAVKWLGILVFSLANLVLVWDVLSVAVNPYFVRIDERRAAGQ